ncbi:hypothetical protein C0J52_25930 [Blattella germanica]|nr:hypothetical protein C0J52_25930 [Blattella germanica]
MKQEVGAKNVTFTLDAVQKDCERWFRECDRGGFSLRLQVIGQNPVSLQQKDMRKVNETRVLWLDCTCKSTVDEIRLRHKLQETLARATKSPVDFETRPKTPNYNLRTSVD